MNRVVMIRIPEVGVQPEGKPGRCGGCGGSRLERWGRSKRRVRDVEVKEVEAVRWRCRDCGRTMREYPCGVGRASQTERVRVLVAIGWSLGLSLRAVVGWMAATVGVRLGVTTAWRDVRAVAEAMRRRRPARVRVLGVDGTGVRWGGQTRGMVVAVDLGTGRPVALAAVDERSPEAVRAWLQPLVEAYGVATWARTGRWPKPWGCGIGSADFIACGGRSGPCGRSSLESLEPGGPSWTKR